MEKHEYENARKRSRGLFNNALILPVAIVVAERIQPGSDFTVADVRAWMGGRAESNQIRDAVRRIEAAEAIVELPYPGRPHPHRWQRNEHPFWTFVTEWAAVKATK